MSLADDLSAAYRFPPPVVTLGVALEGGRVVPEPKIAFPLAMLNRHGVIAGATGTGKTKTLQLLTDQLSAQGVPVFVADMKGDLSGLAAPGARNPTLDRRLADVGVPWEPRAAPVELVSLTGTSGAPLRATVSSFGPLLLAKVLDLNETQTSVLTMVFKVCDDQGLPLLDFDDLRAVLKYLASDEGKPLLADYGGMAPATVGVLLRELVELESQGARQFFGEPELDIHDLLRVTPDGRGVVTCLELADCQDKPALFSTFMMWMLAELYEQLPEAGDLPKPKLVFFFDEAHLLFRGASKAFLEQVELVVRLIRSKGVGIFFVTQTPRDLPDPVLAQLGHRIQHALRVHTPDDEADLKATVRTFPRTGAYDLEETLTTLGIGEAVVTGLDLRGVPTPVAATRLVAPTSRMAPLTPDEMQTALAASALARRYREPVNRDSAFEMLARRLDRQVPPPAAPGPFSDPDHPAPSATRRGPFREPAEPAPRRGPFREPAEPAPGRTRKTAGRAAAGGLVAALATTAARTLGRELIRGLMGALKRRR